MQQKIIIIIIIIILLLLLKIFNCSPFPISLEFCISIELVTLVQNNYLSVVCIVPCEYL